MNQENTDTDILGLEYSCKIYINLVYKINHLIRTHSVKSLILLAFPEFIMNNVGLLLTVIEVPFLFIWTPSTVEIISAKGKW